MEKLIIGSRVSPDIFGVTEELTLTFSWDTESPPPEVFAMRDAFMTGEPVSIGIGPDCSVKYNPMDASRSLGTRPETFTVRLKRIPETP